MDVGWSAHWNIGASPGEPEENQELEGVQEMEIGERMVLEVRERGVVRVRAPGRVALAVWKRAVRGFGGGRSSTERYRGDRRWVEGIRASECAEVVA